jgi:pimeloyl-ACP methyl ester carboxylesterase
MEVTTEWIEVADRYGKAVEVKLHHPDKERNNGPGRAVIFISGAGGGVTGPAGMYPYLAKRFASQGVWGVRQDFRVPGKIGYCVNDVKAVKKYLRNKLGVESVILIGWSFGGAVVIQSGAKDPLVKGVITIASQTAETGEIVNLPPTPLLLLHGTADQCLPFRCSQQLYKQYGGGAKELELLEGDNHGLTIAANKGLPQEKIFSWSMLNLSPPQQR